MYEYQGISFDDVVKDDDGHLWSQICSECAKKVKPGKHSLDDVGSGICGVEGCENEADYYIDFEN